MKRKELKLNKLQEIYIQIMMKFHPLFYKVVFMMGWDYGKMSVLPEWIEEPEPKKVCQYTGRPHDCPRNCIHYNEVCDNVVYETDIMRCEEI